MNSMEFVVLEKEIKKNQQEILYLKKQINNLQTFVIKLTEIIGQQLEKTDKCLEDILKGDENND